MLTKALMKVNEMIQCEIMDCCVHLHHQILNLCCMAVCTH